MDKLLKSLYESLKELNFRHVLKTSGFILSLFIAFSALALYLGSIELDYYNENVTTIQYVVIIASVVFILAYFQILFEITRHATKSMFRLREYAKFVAMFLIICVIFSFFLSLNLLFSDIINNPYNYIFTKSAVSLSEPLSLVRLLTLPTIFAFLSLFMLFYAPFIQYIESVGFGYSIKKSATIFIRKPAYSTASIVVSFLLFIIPSVISMLPFTSAMSPVVTVAEFPLIYYLIVPLSLIPAILGMTIGLILMYSFIVKFYENELINVS